MRDILRRHWEEVGRRNGIVTDSGQGADTLIRDVIDRTPAALDEVVAKLPSGFPGHVADSILSGIKAALGKLGRAAAS